MIQQKKQKYKKDNKGRIKGDETSATRVNYVKNERKD